LRSSCSKSWTCDENPLIGMHQVLIISSALLATAGAVLVVLAAPGRAAWGRGLWTGLAGNVCVVIVSAPLLLAPGGGPRPTYYPWLILLVAVVSLAVGVPWSLREARQAGHRLVGLAGVVLNVTPVFVGIACFDAVAMMKGFV